MSNLGTARAYRLVTLVAASHKQSTGLFVIAPCSIPINKKRSCTLSVQLRFFGAGDGNRTHVTSLEGWNSTIELHPQMTGIIITQSPKKIKCFLKNFYLITNFPCLTNKIMSSIKVLFIKSSTILSSTFLRT